MVDVFKKLKEKKKDFERLNDNFYKIGTDLEKVAVKIREKNVEPSDLETVRAIALKCRDFSSLKSLVVFRGFPRKFNIPKVFRLVGEKLEGVTKAIDSGVAVESHAVELEEEAKGFKDIANKVWGMKKE